MKKREVRLQLPDSRRFIAIDVTDKGMHHFKLPRMLKATEIIKSIDVKSLNFDPSELTTIEFYEKFGQAAEKMCTLIHACWSHEELELESSIPSDLSEELFDNEYTEYEIVHMFNILYVALVESLAPVTKAVEEAPSFLAQAGDSESLS